MTKQETEQRKVLAVARKIAAVQRSLSAFDFEDQQYLPKAVAQAILECEYCFAHKDYPRALHLAKVTAFLVHRLAPRFRADPKMWISRWKELQVPPTRPTRPVKLEPVVMKRVPV